MAVRQKPSEQELIAPSLDRTKRQRASKARREFLNVSIWPILLQKSKIEQPQKSRQSLSLDFSAAVSLFKAATEACDRFWMKRYGPSRRRTRDASAALRNFARRPEKTFTTISARNRHGLMSVLSPLKRKSDFGAFDPNATFR